MDDQIPPVEELAEPILDTIGALVVVLDPEGRIVRFNAACEKTTGYAFEEVKGRKVWDFLLVPEETAPVKGVFKELREEAIPNEFVNYWITKRGDRRLISWSNSTVLDAAGGVRFVVGTGIDITEQTEAEQALQEREAELSAILNAAVDAIITISEAGIIQGLNRAAVRMFGYDAAELIGQNVHILMPEPDRSRHGGYLERYLATKERRIIGVGREVEALRKDGTTFPVHLSVSDVTLPGRRIFTGVLHDITERRVREEQLRQAMKMEAVGQLTGGIAHDFNNLLTVITGNLEMLEARLEGNEQARELAAQAQEAADLGADLTGRLLAFGRRQPLAPKSTNLNALVLDMTEILRRSLGEAIQISSVLASDLEQARVDPGQLQNALLNLALNARDAMPKGGVLVIETANAELDDDYASLHPDVSAGRYVRLSVSDTGAGMSREVQERALEPFFTTKVTGSGTGLGLSMVYGFAKQSNGHLMLYSEAGKGTTVNLYLPSLLAAEKPAAPTAPFAQEAQGQGESILVVEDDPRVRGISVGRLEQLGYHVLEAEDAHGALAVMAQAPKIDLLFTDIVMPGGKSGRDLAREVLARDPRVKVVYTTGFADTAALGADGHLEDGDNLLRKPYKTADLARKLREVLDA